MDLCCFLNKTFDVCSSSLFSWSQLRTFITNETFSLFHQERDSAVFARVIRFCNLGAWSNLVKSLAEENSLHRLTHSSEANLLPKTAKGKIYFEDLRRLPNSIASIPEHTRLSMQTFF
jgi:hypothetical protein